MSASRTLQNLLAAAPDDAAALRAPGTAPLCFGRLRALAKETVTTLNGFGVGRGDRVAILLPNGPEMAAAFLAVAQGATAAPLNPAYKLDEFEFYMEDLKARALVVEAGSASAAIDAAKRLGVRVLTLTPRAGGAGEFALSGDSPTRAGNRGFAAPEDIALILHTSGTTSRPKIVPLSQRNVAPRRKTSPGRSSFPEAIAA